MKNKYTKSRITLRNQKIQEEYAKINKKYPHWKSEYIIERLADKYFLSKRTIEDILKK